MTRIPHTHSSQQSLPIDTNLIRNVIDFGVETLYEIKSVAVTTGLIVLHELGHAAAATLLYNHANPRIQFSWQGGLCTYNASQLSTLGTYIGSSNSSVLVASAGPLVEIVSMLAATTLSGGKKKIAKLMALSSFKLSLYALSAFWTCFPGHDFCEVWSKGGMIAYGALTASCLATTALIWRNATRGLFQKSSNTPPPLQRKQIIQLSRRPTHSFMAF